MSYALCVQPELFQHVVLEVFGPVNRSQRKEEGQYVRAFEMAAADALYKEIIILTASLSAFERLKERARSELFSLSGIFGFNPATEIHRLVLPL
jgi:hypothetical protein